VRGLDGFELDESCSMTEISRDPLDLVAQVCGVHHSYPDGFMLFLGTSFAPIADRDAPGRGFTHHPGDIVSIDCPRLGTLVNSVHPVADTPPWRTGVRALMQMLHDLRTTPP
jgi:fumarylacetoacetate (FAA) hydrolase family protein